MLDEVAQLDSFRLEIRSWCEQHVPKNWRKEQVGASYEQFVEFHKWWASQLRNAGYLAPHWPKEWGGGGFSLAQQVVFAEELSRGDVPRNALYQVALYNAGPTILHAGTPEQKQRFLPGILSGDVWCQGFSEPNAGSDLASLSTKAVKDGDNYVVTGQKVWTSMGHEADWCILLARTNPDVPKRNGISFFLMDMKSPGVEVRRIKQATGQSEFCETFLDEVLIPKENLLGPENEGWQVSQSTLASERGVVIIELSERLRRNGVEALIRKAGEWTLEDGSLAVNSVEVQDMLVTRYAEISVLRMLLNRMISNILRRGGVGPEASVVKLYYSELLHNVMKDGTNLQGFASQLEYPPLLSAGLESGVWMNDYVNSWSWTIGGGTSEIMRNIIGERVLGLPREPEVAVKKGAVK